MSQLLIGKENMTFVIPRDESTDEFSSISIEDFFFKKKVILVL